MNLAARLTRWIALMATPDIAVLVSTFQRPQHLRRVLASIACQQLPSSTMEIVVSDDGSTDETAEVVKQFAHASPCRVAFTTHKHSGFHLARCRNEGVACSTAPYLLFLDGDCLIPPHHVRAHLARRRPRTVMGGYCFHLDRERTQQVDLKAVRQATFARGIAAKERRRIRSLMLRSLFYEWIRHPRKPRLFGGNIGIWREDYERINGYDENFQGWGCEDDDLRLRLRQSGIRIRTILPWTQTYHLWHPPSPSAPSRWKEGQNVAYLLREERAARCDQGLQERTDFAVCAWQPYGQPESIERTQHPETAAA